MENKIASTAVVPQLSQAFGGGLWGDVVSNTLVLGGAATVISALARAINQTRQSVDEYGGVPMDVHLNTTMKDPVMHSMGIADGKNKKGIIGKSASMDKQAEEGFWGSLKSIGRSSLDIVQSGAKGVTKATEALAGLLETATNPKTWDTKETFRWAVPGAGILFGAIAGSRMVDNIYDKSDEAALDKRKKELSDLHKDIITARALQARGALSRDVYADILARATKVSRSADINKTAEDKSTPDSDQSILMATLGVIAAATAGIGGYGAYQYAASRNPNRLKYDAIKAGLKSYAQDNALMRTLDQRLTDDPELYKKLSSLVAKNKKSPVETPIEYNQVTI